MSSCTRSCARTNLRCSVGTYAIADGLLRLIASGLDFASLYLASLEICKRMLIFSMKMLRKICRKVFIDCSVEDWVANVWLGQCSVWRCLVISLTVGGMFDHFLISSIMCIIISLHFARYMVRLTPNYFKNSFPSICRRYIRVSQCVNCSQRDYYINYFEVALKLSPIEQ